MNAWLDSLRVRLVLAALVVAGSGALVADWALQRRLVASYEQIERGLVVSSIGQVAHALESQARIFGQVANEWAVWTEMYDFVRRPNAKAARSVFGPDSIAASGIDGLLVFDAHQRLVHRAFVPAAEADGAALQLALTSYWPSANMPLDAPECGMSTLNAQLYLVCRKAIQDSAGTSEARGGLVVVRQVRGDMLAEIATQTGVAFTLDRAPVADGPPMLVLAAVATPLFGGEPVRLRVQAEQLQVHWRPRMLADAGGGPTVHATLARSLADQGREVVNQVRLSNLLIGATALALLMLSVNALVVRRLARLTSSLAHIQAGRAWQRRVPQAGRDEIGTLSLRTNALLAVIEEQITALARSATTDALTGLPNRRAFDAQLDALMAQGSPLVLVLVDVDDFKRYNDEYGHPAGDVALIAVAESLQSAADGAGVPGLMAARIGGEEFALLAPHCTQTQALRVVEAARLALAQRRVVHAHSRTGSLLSFSAGLAERLAGSAEPPRLLYARSDKALYAAKAHGRNRTVAVP